MIFHFLDKLLEKTKDATVSYVEPTLQDRSGLLKDRFTSGITRDELKTTSDAVRLILSLSNSSQREVFKNVIQQTINDFKRKENDTGSCEVQGNGL